MPPTIRWIRRDDGTPSRRPEKLPRPAHPSMMVFNFPNLWQNRISKDVRITAAFVPVGEENSVIYNRSYQRFVQIPLVRSVVNAVFNRSSI
jgi:phenylpropionate dioxygenase-like ring-hydroxylating dioxygenase large terminal subunit